jgi:hypothetical protein
MAGYSKGGFGRLRAGAFGKFRFRESLSAPIVIQPPVAGGFYVSPSGSDVANGSSDTPFGTIGRALTATRAGAEKRIFLRGGTHTLTAKLSLTAADSGTTFTAYPGETVIISGGEKLTGFLDEGDGFYTKALAQPSSLDLFIGGVRQRVSQIAAYSPENPYRSGWLQAGGDSGFTPFTNDFTGDFYGVGGGPTFTNEFTNEFEGASTVSPSSFTYKEGDVPSGIFSSSLMAQVFDVGRKFDFISSVSAIDSTAMRITLADSHYAGPIEPGSTYRLMNHPSFIGRDGEFAWRSNDSRLVVRPSSSNFEAQGVIIPKLDGLIDVQGGANDITFLGLTFSDAKYSGYAVSITNSHRTRFGNCVFRNVGDGLRVSGGTNGKVAGCSFNDLANSGIVLNDGANGWKVYASKFNHLGKIKKGAAALYGQGGNDVMFAFNEVQYSPRYGVTFKNGGSYRVIYNTIKDTANETADSAAIEFVGESLTDESSLVEGNYIDRSPGYPENATGEFSDEFNSTEFNISTESPRAFSSSVYLNDLASGVTVRGNFTRGASAAHFLVDGGDRNVFENNVSILDEFDKLYAQISANTTLASSDLKPDSTAFRRNVIYSIPNRAVNPWMLSGLGTGTLIDENVYYNAAKVTGYDSLSVVSDPRFLNRAADDFRFDPSSPALAIGVSQLNFDSMGVKGYTLTASTTYGLENFHGAVLSPGTVDPGTGFAVQASQVENIDSIASLEGQPNTVGLMFADGDVMPGQVIVGVVDGKDVPCQFNHRIYWPNGSLRTTTAVWEMPAVAAGQKKEIVWTRRNGSWNDTPKHTSTTAITGKVSLEYAFTSWKGRNAANTLTAERGPKYFRSADMLATGNTAWIERTMSGPVMTEWRTSIFAKLANSTTDPNFACLLYVRAWGGTANNPTRIQFLFRTMHGWTDSSVPADEQGLRCSMDLKIGSTTIRGSSLGTAGWADRDGFKGGFYASCGADGKMDWINASNATLSTLPKLVVRHDFAYCVKTYFFPPFDVNNPEYSPSASIDYAPQTRGNLIFQQDGTGDFGHIPWHVSTQFTKAMIAHARRGASEVDVQDRVARVTAWGLGAVGNIGFDKTTRKLHCFLPPERNPNPAGIGPSVYNNTKPTITAGDLNPYIKGRDSAHFPQVTYWTALTEGDTHMRDLCMAEATIPPLFEPAAYGFYGTLMGMKFGHSSHSGQTRSVGQTYRPMLCASILADPQDPNGQLAQALLDMQLDVVKIVPASQDAWRGGTTLQDNHMLHPPSGNEPNYKMWMHLFAAKALTYAAPLLQNPKVTEQAHWWMWLPIVISGGYKNDSDYLMKPDPFQASLYTHLVMSGPGPNAVATDRQAWRIGQWPGSPRAVDYLPDGQTITAIGGIPMQNGMIITITGIHASGEPPEVSDFSKQPSGLTRGVPYYAIQSSGQSCKLSLTPGGNTPVTFNTGGATIRGMVARSLVNGVTGLTAVGTVTGTGPGSYFVQHMVALAIYRHTLAKTDARVQLARNALQVYKDADTQQPRYDIRGKTTVPL